MLQRTISTTLRFDLSIVGQNCQLPPKLFELLLQCLTLRLLLNDPRHHNCFLDQEPVLGHSLPSLVLQLAHLLHLNLQLLLAGARLTVLVRVRTR